MALKAKGLEYRLLNVRTPGAARRFNPRGRVPSLVIDGETFVDSTDILTELDARFPDPPLMPTDPRKQAWAKLWEDWADEVLYFYLVWLRWGIDANFERIRRERMARLPLPLRLILPRVARRIATRRCRLQGVGLKEEAVIYRELGECLDAVDTVLEGRDYLVDERLTRADLAVAAVVDQLADDRLTPDAAAEVERRANVTAWLDRVHEVAPAVR
jgi:glutathione S-transferase